jgi:hypothetical protein
MTREQKTIWGFFGASAGVLIIALVGAILSFGRLLNQVENLSQINNALAKEFILVKESTIRTEERVKNVDYRVRRIEIFINARKR